MTASGGAPAPHPASFRDPAGFVFEASGEIHRAVHPDAVPVVERLFDSGLHDELVAEGLLVRHVRATRTFELPPGWLVLRAERVAIISYACEWTDTQLQAAALVTLEVQRRALGKELTLKDASSFNVQFVGARPVFIDLLSFTPIGTTRAWVAYRQFCEHFLGPLALRRHVPGAAALAGASLDGVPLPLASRLLPAPTWLRPGLALHVHMHARSIVRTPPDAMRQSTPVSAPAAASFGLQLAQSLDDTVRGLGVVRRQSNWSAYRSNNVYSASAADAKLEFVLAAVALAGARRALDLGANDGHYARALASRGIACTAVEMDAACSEDIHAASLAMEAGAAPLNTVRADLTNPTPAHGWAGTERTSFLERMRCDITLSLALIHHLSIAHQVPFEAIAEMLAGLAPDAVVEYVPPDDPMARQLLAARTGVTAGYLEMLSYPAFERAFAPRFGTLARSEPVAGGRILHHFRKKPSK